MPGVHPTGVLGMLNSPVDLAMLLLLALLLFGAKRLPEIARSLGTGMREFKDSVTGMTETPPSVAAPPQLPPGVAPPPAEHQSPASTEASIRDSSSSP